MTFEKLIGNEQIKQNLINILSNNTMSHSYMFIGTAGIGKLEFAKEFAKGILCSNNKKPCGNCKSCIEFESGNNPEYNEINLGEESSIKIDIIRQLQNSIQQLPIISDRKVYIINDSEYMTKEAQNCLLKTLEEPPKFVTIILIVSNENTILNTVKSRCTKLYFKDISENELKKYIEDNNLDLLNDTKLDIVKIANGSIGKLIKIYENKDLYIKVNDVFNNIENFDITDVISKLDVLYKNKEHITEILEYINTIFIEKAKQDYKYIEYISYIEETKKAIKQNANFDMTIDKLLFNIWDN